MASVHEIKQLEMKKEREREREEREKIVGAVIESAFVHIFQG